MSLPYFPLYPTDFDGKTAHLTLLEDGAYNRLLRLCWKTPGCRIPADETWIMRHMRACTPDEQEAVRSILAEFFTAKGDFYTNKKLSEIYAETSASHERRKNAGSKGGKAKSRKTKENGSSNAKAMPKQPEPEPEYTEDTSVSSDADGVDFAKVLFDRGVAFLGKHGTPERQARSLIGKWRKDHDDREVFDAFAEASKQGVIDPASWIAARLRPKATNVVDWDAIKASMKGGGE